MNDNCAVSWAYVACYRGAPDEAYAVVVDNPTLASDVAESVAEFINDGAIVTRVPLNEAQKMLFKYFYDNNPDA